MKKILQKIKTIKLISLDIKKLTALSLLLTLTANLYGCSLSDNNLLSDPSAPVSVSAFMLDTFISIDAYPTDSSILYEETLQEALDLCKKYENLFSKTITTSDVYKINAAGGKPVKVCDETIELISKGLYYSELSGGVYDITIGSVSSLWDFHAESPQVPDANLIDEAVSHVDYHNVIVDEVNNTITLKDPLAKIDLGSIAKGYIADKIKEFLVSEGIDSALINLGGNVLAVGEKPEKRLLMKGKYTPFNVGVKEPFSDNQIYTSIKLSDTSLVSSGDYERYFKKDGKLYHHILDTKTGYPVESNLDGVSIVSKTSVDGDALSTICFALGKEKAEEFLTSPDFEDVEVIFIP